VEKQDIDKAAVFEALRTRIDEALERLIASQKTVQAGAIHEENRQEGPKDTRAIEATYLARGLAERAETLREAGTLLAALRLKDYGDDDPIGIGALVATRDDEDRQGLVFLVPAGGGEHLEVGETAVQSLTPQSPFGGALVGHRAGDEVEIRRPRGASTVIVEWVA
jgi:transcription elongation GreA/GreB family factor